MNYFKETLNALTRMGKSLKISCEDYRELQKIKFAFNASGIEFIEHYKHLYVTNWQHKNKALEIYQKVCNKLRR